MMPKCPHCNEETEHSEKYDSLLCPKCNRWLEPKCNNWDCYFCQKRPDKPSDTVGCDA